MRELERDLPETAGLEADPTALPRLAIVGRGRVGGAIALLAERTGLAAETAGRDDLAAVCARCEAALLCVADADIESACAEVAEHIPPLRLVGHVSGATTLTALAAAAERGAETFSLHPLQTVPDPDAELIGAACAIAGSSPSSLAFAGELARHLGMRAFEVPEERRAAYHAAASIASNFMIALEESASELLGTIGVEGARDLLAPLVLRTAANWADNGAAALTGPIARGDEATVARHRDALAEAAPRLLPLYDALAERTRDVAGGR